MRLNEVTSIILFLNDTIDFDIEDSVTLIKKSKVLSSLVKIDEEDWIQSEAQLLNEFLQEVGCNINSEIQDIKIGINEFMEAN